MPKELIAYYKPCISCTFDDWCIVQQWASRNGIKLVERRTEYNPIWHKKATAVWGDEMYPPFITTKDGSAYAAIEYVIEELMEGRDDDLQDLFRTKEPTRKGGQMVAKKKTRTKAAKKGKK